MLLYSFKVVCGTQTVLGCGLKLLLAAKTTVCGVALIGLNVLTSWVEKELKTLDISYLKEMPRPIAESDSFQKGQGGICKNGSVWLFCHCAEKSFERFTKDSP